jgi:Domain of unknown function (DUF1772)
MIPATDVRITRFASQLSCGILVGVALTVLVVELALRRLDGPAYIAVRHAEFDYLTWFVGAVFVPTLIAVTTHVIAAYRKRSPFLRPALLALTLVLVALAITLLVNGPINIGQLRWTTQSPPADWAQVRDRWQVAHAARTVALALALGCLVIPRSSTTTRSS